MFPQEPYIVKGVFVKGGLIGRPTSQEQQNGTSQSGPEPPKHEMEVCPGQDEHSSDTGTVVGSVAPAGHWPCSMFSAALKVAPEEQGLRIITHRAVCSAVGGEA